MGCGLRPTYALQDRIGHLANSGAEAHQVLNRKGQHVGYQTITDDKSIESVPGEFEDGIIAVILMRCSLGVSSIWVAKQF